MSIGEICWVVTKVSVRRIKWESFGIIQNRCDASFCEMLSYVIPGSCADNIEIIDMFATDPYFRRHNVHARSTKGTFMIDGERRSVIGLRGDAGGEQDCQRKCPTR